MLYLYFSLLLCLLFVLNINQSKKYRGKGLNNYFLTLWSVDSLPTFNLANSFGNTSSAKSLQKRSKQFGSRQKSFPNSESRQLSGIYIYTYTFIEYYCTHWRAQHRDLPGWCIFRKGEENGKADLPNLNFMGHLP